MVDPAKLALLNAELDGELDARGRAELAREVLADPTLHGLRQDLQRLDAALNALPAAEPPADLTTRVLAALPQARARTLRSSWAGAGWRRAAVLAGLVASGSIVYAVIDGLGPPSAEVAGTLAARESSVVDTVRLESGPVVGRVRLTESSAGLWLDAELVAEAPVDLIVTSAGRTIRVPAAGGATGTRVTAALPGIPAGGQAVELRLLAGGREIGAATLHAPAAR